MDGKLHRLSVVAASLVVVVDYGGGGRQMNVPHGTCSPSHLLLNHAVSEVHFPPRTHILKNEVGKRLVGKTVGIPVASVLLLQQNQVLKGMVERFH